MTDPMRVTMVRTVVTPIPTLAGAEALSRKKLTQDMITIRLDGTYTYNKLDMEYTVPDVGHTDAC